MRNRGLLTLAIETSCDETAVAVVRGEREALSDVVSSQIDIHQIFGGVVPEIASRHHLERINAVAEQALAEAGVRFGDIDLVGVTQGPGLVGALLIGVAAAKSFAYALDRPLVGVHHIRAHVCANYIEHPELEPPFLALVVSGGHTNLVRVRDYNVYEVLGATCDDAAGEAFDKVARVLGLSYPGGPAVDAAAEAGNLEAVDFKRVLLGKDSLDFSFSGLKTSVMNHVNTERQAGREIRVADIAASFRQAVVDVLTAKTLLAARRYGEKKIVTAGGVAANRALRQALANVCAAEGIALYSPSPALCTDNGAMVGVAAALKYREFGGDDLNMDAFPGLEL